MASSSPARLYAAGTTPLLLAIWVASCMAARQCWKCDDALLPPHACNDTRCDVTAAENCRLERCSCDTLCQTTVTIKGEERWVLALCFPGDYVCSGAVGEHRELSDIYSRDEIEGRCDVDDRGGVSCQCGGPGPACNDVISVPYLVPTSAPGSNVTIEDLSNAESDGWMATVVAGTACGVVASLVIVILVMCLRRHYRMKHAEELECKLTARSRLSSDDASLLDAGWDESGKHSFSTYKYSSSVATQYTRGSRGNALNHNDHFLPIELQKIIGKGRFAEVWKAKLQQDEECEPRVVSVKLFRLRNYGAWRQEKDMLTENWMRHENIIEFYAPEQRTIRGKLQYWLVTAYYKHGSLAEFLRSHVLGWRQLCDMCQSIASGLSYLHDERDASGSSKIPIAHRDIKSCNILVKDDRNSCVLADFGLSLKLDPNLTREELANAGQVGTSRYMAPELLERLVNLSDAESFKRVDVYAMSLVMWEMTNRCEALPGMSSPYEPVFGEHIKEHPTKQQMLVHVCKERHLPEIREKWRKHKGMSEFCEILVESWEFDAEERITAGCVFERLVALRRQEDQDDDEKKAGDCPDDLESGGKVEEKVAKLRDVITTVV